MKEEEKLNKITRNRSILDFNKSIVTSERSRQSSINKAQDVQSDSDNKLHMVAEKTHSKYVSKWLEDDNQSKRSVNQKISESEVSLNEIHETKNNKIIDISVNPTKKNDCSIRKQRRRSRKYFNKLGVECDLVKPSKSEAHSDDDVFTHNVKIKHKSEISESNIVFNTKNPKRIGKFQNNVK